MAPEFCDLVKRSCDPSCRLVHDGISRLSIGKEDFGLDRRIDRVQPRLLGRPARHATSVNGVTSGQISPQESTGRLELLITAGFYDTITVMCVAIATPPTTDRTTRTKTSLAALVRHVQPSEDKHDRDFCKKHHNNNDTTSTSASLAQSHKKLYYLISSAAREPEGERGLR